MATGMTCTEFKTQVAALALSVLDAEADAACRAHLDDPGPHQGCPQAIALAMATAAQLGLALAPVRPRERVWHALERAVGVSDPAHPLHKPRLLRWVAILAALIATGLLVQAQHRAAALQERLGGATRSLSKVRTYAADMVRNADRCETRETEVRQQLSANLSKQAQTSECLALQQAWQEQLLLETDALAMLEQPATRIFPLRALDGGHARASVIYNPDQARAIVFASALPERPGMVWQVWVTHQGVPASAGFLATPTSGLATGEIAPSLLAIAVPEAIAISTELPGGALRPGEVVVYGVVQATLATAASVHGGGR